MKTILITGSTDGIGLETAKKLLSMGHRVLIHGRSPDKIKKVEEELKTLSPDRVIETYTADLLSMREVERLAREVAAKHKTIDILINNAGIYRVSDPITKKGLDARFVVNTIAPYYLTKLLLAIMEKEGRVINLSSAAQSSLDIKALLGDKTLDDSEAYAQSKLGLTMWSHRLGSELRENGPAVIAVNPRSFLGSKMVKEAYGITGNDLSIGADILARTSLSDEFRDAGGRYFDNDVGDFATPHPDTFDAKKVDSFMTAMESLLEKVLI